MLFHVADQQTKQLLAQSLPVQLLIAVAESKTTGEGTESPDAAARTCLCTAARNIVLPVIANAASPATAVLAGIVAEPASYSHTTHVAGATAYAPSATPSAAPSAAALAAPSAAAIATRAASSILARPSAAAAVPPPAVTTSQPPLTAQGSPSAAPALAHAGSTGFSQTYPGEAAAIPLGGATSSLPIVNSAASAAAGGSAAVAPGAALAMTGAIAPTSRTVVVPLPAAANLPLATQTGATAATSAAQLSCRLVQGLRWPRLQTAVKLRLPWQMPEVTLQLVKGQRSLPKRGSLLLRRLRAQVGRLQTLIKRHILMLTLPYG